MARSEQESHDFILQEFTRLDADKSGRVPSAGLRQVLELKGASAADIQMVMQQSVDDSGLVDYAKLIAWLCPNVNSNPTVDWTPDCSIELQNAVDRVFSTGSGKALAELDFSFTLADPLLEGCPLIGCSIGFATLCGYTMPEIVGRNCRFLVDPVPKEYTDASVRKQAREYCDCVRENRQFVVADAEKQAFAPQGRHADDGLFCVQMNARKDGSLFQNMFYLKAVDIEGHPYITGLQTELRDEATRDLCYKACQMLDEAMWEVERTLASKFWISTAMRRQESRDTNDGYVDLWDDSVLNGANNGASSPQRLTSLPESNQIC